MREFRIHILLIAIVLVISSFKGDSSSVLVKTTMADMFAKTADVKTMTFVMKKKERIKGEMVNGEVRVKLNVEPYKVFIEQIDPDPGMEILFVKNQNNNKAIVYPNGFPWVNVNLDPMGDRMRRDQHHTILETGFDYVMSILKYEMEEQGESVYSKITVRNNTLFDGRACRDIIYNNPDYKILDYTVKNDETLLRIARKFHLSEFMLLELNPRIENFHQKIEQKEIKISSAYASRLEISLDNKLGVPIAIRVFDNKGMFEAYEYYELKINPTIKPEEFTSSYEGYSF